MQKTVRNVFFIGLALSMSIATLLILSFVVGRFAVLTIPATDFLPADRTIAVLHHTTAAQNTVLRGWFPELAYMTQEDAEVVALIALPGGGRGSVVFRKATPETPAAYTRGGFMIELSDPLLLPFIQQSPTSLSTTSLYRALSERRTAREPWVYLTRSALPSGEDLRSALTAGFLYSNSAAISFSLEEGGGIRIDRVAPEHRASALEDIPLFFTGTVLTFSASDMREMIHTLESTLSTDQQFVLQSILRSFMSDTFGPNVSVEYSILPLFTRDTTVHVWNKNGKRLFVVRGTVEDKRELEENLQIISESFKSTLPTSHVSERSFDSRFFTRSIQSDPEQISEEEQRLGVWNVHVIQGESPEDILIVALSGDHFALSNDPSMLELVVQRKGSVPPAPTLHIARTGVGVIDLEALDTLFGAVIPKSDVQVLPIHFTGSVLIQMLSHGPVETIIIH